MRHLKSGFVFLITLGICGGCSPKTTESPTETSIPTEPSVSTPSTPTLLSQVEDKTLDPLCILSALFDNESSVIPMENCSGEFIKDEGFQNEDGSVGVRFHTQDPSRSQPYITYLPVGKLGDDLIVSANWNTGGTGQNSTLVRLSEKDHTIEMAQHYTYGDRCNGGLNSAEVKDGQVYYSVHATRYGLLNIVKTDTGMDWPFGIVDGSAVGCVANVEYKDGALQGVRLPDGFANSLASTRVSGAENPEQYCYDNFLLGQKDGYFPASAFPGFISEIEHVCFGAPTGEMLPMEKPVLTIQSLDTVTSVLVNQCAIGNASACDQAHTRKEMNDSVFSTLHAKCNAGEKVFCTLLDNLVAAELRAQQ